MKTDLKKIKINDPIISIFSDIHFGKSKDNLTKIKIAIDFCEWFLQNCKTKSIFFLGDWFDNRNSINVHTHNIAFSCLEKLAKKFHIYLVIGNHDTYYKNSSDVNSVSHFGAIENVEIIKDLTEIDFNGKTGLFCPWNFNFEEIKDSQYDFLFGHFEANGSVLFGSVFNEGRYTIEDLTKISPLGFSGHFHINKEYNTKHGKLIMVGDPFELDWGDIGNKKGFYELNVQTKEYTRIENTISPIHLKYYWSQLEDGHAQLEESKIKNNYIKLVVDRSYDYFKVMDACDKINNFHSVMTIPEFTFSLKEGLITDLKFDKLELKSDKLFYILKYIDKMEMTETNLNKEDIKNLAKQYFESAKNSMNEDV